MKNEHEKRKEWLIYATLFNLNVYDLYKDKDFIDIYTSIDEKIIKSENNCIYVVFNNIRINLDYTYSYNKNYYTYKIININNKYYTIFIFKIDYNDYLQYSEYKYSLCLSVRTSFSEKTKNKIIENCCKIQYYSYEDLFDSYGYKKRLEYSSLFY